jgi:pimeloyl-ACP methyl ester carboxylesterase
MPHHIHVDGGMLAVDVHTTAAEPVLAVHGVSSNRKLWNWVHAQAPEISLLAPDLRGRADSVDVRGPSSVHQHAEDMVRVLDHLGLASAVVCGMSMGGFVAVDLAVHHPDRVSKLVLVDGGFPMAAHAQLTPELVPAAFAPHLAMIERPWPDLDEYVSAHAAADSLLSTDDPHLRDYLGHFLGADGHVRLDPDVLLTDAADVIFSRSRWPELTTPAWFCYAEWGVDRDTPPAYSPDDAATFHDALACLAEPRRVPGVDHAALIMTDQGAAAVVDLLRTALR